GWFPEAGAGRRRRGTAGCLDLQYPGVLAHVRFVPRPCGAGIEPDRLLSGIATLSQARRGPTAASASFGARGSRTLTFNPPESASSRDRLPPWARAIELHSASPRPTEPVKVRASSRREKGRNASMRRASEMPGPWSETVMIAWVEV